MYQPIWQVKKGNVYVHTEGIHNPTLQQAFKASAASRDMSRMLPAWRHEQNHEQLPITPNLPFTHRDPALAKAIL